MLYAEMRANYFAGFVLRYQNLDRWIRVTVLLSSSGAAATALSSAEPWIKLALPILAAAGSFWLMLFQYGMLSRDASELHAGWSTLHTEYERLWNHLDNPDAESQFYSIYDKGESLSRAGTKFPNKRKQLGELLDHAAALATARYA